MVAVRTVEEITTSVDCNSSNVIYLITYNQYSLQYFGKIAQNLNERFNWKRTVFNQPSKKVFCRVTSYHSRKITCRNLTYSVKILEKLEGKGRVARNALIASVTSRIKQYEKIC